MNPAPYAIRMTHPIYDGRDAIVGRQYALSEMRYGTVAGVLAALRMDRYDDPDTHCEAWDVRAGAPVSRADVLRALKLNAWAWRGHNTKHDHDSIPF